MHPILFKIPLPHITLPSFLGGGQLSAFPIYAYGVMLGLSLVVGWYLALGLAKRDGLPRETMANNYVFTAFCAIVGARLLYVMTNLGEFHTWRDYLSIRSGGLVAYGGFLGGFLGSWYFCWRKEVRLLAWADAAVPALASGLFFTRIGCYLFGCDFGKPLTESAPNWLKRLGTFPEWHYDYRAGKFLDAEGLQALYADPAHRPQILSGAPAWVQHLEPFPQVRDLHHSLPVHPTQIYESLCGLLLLAVLFWARRSIKARETRGEPFFRGELFLVFTFGYGMLRFLLEIVRDDAERGTFGPHVEPHILYPLTLMVLALSFVVGLSNIVAERYRTLARVVAVLVPFAIFMAWKPANRFDVVAMVQLSTSQWIALFTGVLAALYYRRGIDIALLDPEKARDLGAGVPELVAMEEAYERGEPYPAKDESEQSPEQSAEAVEASEQVTAEGEAAEGTAAEESALATGTEGKEPVKATAEPSKDAEAEQRA